MVYDDLMAQPLSDEAAASGRQRILIVDDDPAQADVLAYRLSNQGFEVFVAGSGQQALDAARIESLDLVLLDIGLPDINGLAVCRELADDEETCGIPVIILSGRDEADMLRAARAAGCKYFVRKPYDPNALLLLIQDSLATAQSW
jgi:DNA-binding response OmpR family regulator